MTELLLPGISVRLIQQLVVKHYRLPADAMTSRRRCRDFAHPRQLAMVLALEYTRQSKVFIGRRAGGRHHTTVLHSQRAVERRETRDQKSRDDRAELRAMIDQCKVESDVRQAEVCPAEPHLPTKNEGDPKCR